MALHCLCWRGETELAGLVAAGAAGLSEAMLGEGPWQPLGDLGLKYMRTIKASSTHLASLIRDILDAAAASHGSLAIQLQKVAAARLRMAPVHPQAVLTC